MSESHSYRDFQEDLPVLLRKASKEKAVVSCYPWTHLSHSRWNEQENRWRKERVRWPWRTLGSMEK
jgi:hypothetical protein